MKLRYFLELAYNGKNYHGWQIQPNQISIQEVMENALATILRQEHIRIQGAGRTDTGVHAKKMFAHFNFDGEMPEDILHRLNSFLPEDIAIYYLHKVTDDAHARFDAYERTYQYHVQIGKNPHNFDFSWQLRHSLNFDEMNKACKHLIGTKDFASFARLHSDVKTTICDVKHAIWEQNGTELVFTITANRFLRNMVRAIVGTLVDVGKGKKTSDEISEIIEQKDRSFAGGSAPAQGLFLTDVKYPKSLFRNE